MSLKLKQPDPFNGEMDAEVVARFLFGLEMYFQLTNTGDGHTQALFTTTLLKG